MTKSDRPAHKRKLRNYLLDAGLQLRYTVFILAVGGGVGAGVGAPH
jgi:hypothetical protein